MVDIAKVFGLPFAPPTVVEQLVKQRETGVIQPSVKAPFAPTVEGREAAAAYEERKAAAPAATAAVNGNGGGGGGITVRPWWDIFPKTPTEVVTRTLEEPVVSPVGGAAVVFKSITKQTGMRFLPAVIAAGGGFLVGRLFGGGSQELQQQQDLTQTPEVTVTPDQPTDVTVDPTIKSLLDIISELKIKAGAGEIDLGGGTVTGDVGTTEVINITNTYPTSYNIQKTYTITKPVQITKTVTTTTAAQEQEATQEQGMDLVTLAVISILGLIGYSMFKKRG